MPYKRYESNKTSYVFYPSYTLLQQSVFGIIHALWEILWTFEKYRDTDELAQHCLFADTVLPCRTCHRLKMTSKVRQRNDPVRLRVCNPRTTGSTAICHPTCLLETLAQPNYCVSETTERSTDVEDVVATSKHR